MSTKKDKYFEKIIYKGEILAIVVRGKDLDKFSSSGEKMFFPTPLDFPFQLGFQNREDHEIVEPHFHREFKNLTFLKSQEFFYVLSGKLRVDLFHIQRRNKIDEIILKKGDSMIVNTGHGVEFIEKGQLMVLRQGPHRGRDEEKFFN